AQRGGEARDGCGGEAWATKKTACRRTATRSRARLRWQRSPRAGGGNSVALITCSKLGQPLSQTAPLQHGRKALHRRRPTLLRSLYRAISRRSYDQLGALKPVLVPARPRQPLHDLPPNGRLVA